MEGRAARPRGPVPPPPPPAVWYTMAASIALVWTMNLLAAVLLLLQRMPDPAFAWALRLGLVVSLVGMAVAFPMTQETPVQARAAEAGRGGGPAPGAPAGG